MSQNTSFRIGYEVRVHSIQCVWLPLNDDNRLQEHYIGYLSIQNSGSFASFCLLRWRASFIHEFQYGQSTIPIISVPAKTMVVTKYKKYVRKYSAGISQGLWLRYASLLKLCLSVSFSKVL